MQNPRRKFSPLLAVRETKAAQIIRQSTDADVRKRYRAQLEMYRRYRTP